MRCSFKSFSFSMLDHVIHRSRILRTISRDQRCFKSFRRLFYLRKSDGLVPSSSGDEGEEAFCSDVKTIVLELERDLEQNEFRRANNDYAALTYLFRDRFVVDGIRGLRSRGDGDRDILRFGFRSRLDRLLCVGGVLKIQRRSLCMALVFQHLLSERNKRRTMEGNWDWWSPTLICLHRCSSNCLWKEGEKL